MVAPLLAALARGAAKSAGKNAAKKAAAKGARAAKKGDIATKARKRYYRSAERNLKKAEQSSGATAARYRQLARQDFEDALSTYDKATKQKFSKPIQRLADQFGYDLEKGRDKFATSGKERLRKISESRSVMETQQQDVDIRREREARALLSNDMIGSRILGGLVDVWREAATVVDASGKVKIDTSKILPTLFDYFNVDNVADMLDKIEDQIGSRLYEDVADMQMYETVKILIQTRVADNALVA